MERLTAWERIRRVNPYIWDALLAVGVFGLAVLLEILFLFPQGDGIDAAGHVAPCFRIDAGGRGLLALACAPLVWRRRVPLAALAATSIAIVLLQVRDYPTDFAGMAFLVAAYSAAAYRERWIAVMAPRSVEAGGVDDVVLSALSGGIVLAAWTAAVVVAGADLMQRRDVA